MNEDEEWWKFEPLPWWAVVLLVSVVILAVIGLFVLTPGPPP